MKKTIIFAIILISIPSLMFAGTLFEDTKRTSTPYVAERGGFNSLFVNPAGAAGQSGFELAVNVGAATSINEIKLVTAVTDMAMGMATGGMDNMSMADAGQSMSELYDAGIINDALIDSIFQQGVTTPTMDSASIDWSDPAAVQAAAESLTQTEIDEIAANAATIMDGTNTDFYTALDQTMGEITMEAAASFKTGFLIKGFGLGVYDNAVMVAYMDPAAQTYGAKTLYNELGLIAGGGFNLFKGKLALGFSGNYGVLMQTNNLAFEDFGTLWDTSLNYGYNWGIDLGAIWRPAPSLGIGVVFNDVFGYTEADTPRTAAGIQGFIAEEAYLMSDFDYQVTLDMDLGMSWQPDWRHVKPKIGVDFYNVIGYGRTVAELGESPEDAAYRVLEHIRVGAHFTFFNFLKLGAQYHDHYIAAGLGLDLLFLELYGEVKVHDQAVYATDFGDVPLAADVMVRLHF